MEISNSSFIRRFISFIIDYIILLPLIFILYQVWKDYLWNGRSIGNKITGNQLVDFKTSKKPSILKIVVRNVIFLLTLGLGFLLVFFNDSRRGLGDLICSTFLVKKVKFNKN